MTHSATHKNFKNWELVTIKLDWAVKTTEKAMQLIDQEFNGSVWFPLSCVNIIGDFEVEVPTWLLSKKGLQYLA